MRICELTFQPIEIDIVSYFHQCGRSVALLNMADTPFFTSNFIQLKSTKFPLFECSVKQGYIDNTCLETIKGIRIDQCSDGLKTFWARSSVWKWSPPIVLFQERTIRNIYRCAFAFTRAQSFGRAMYGRQYLDLFGFLDVDGIAQSLDSLKWLSAHVPKSGQTPRTRKTMR